MYPVSVAIDCWLLSVQQFQNYCQFSQDQLGNKQREDSCGNFVGVTESERADFASMLAFSLFHTFGVLTLWLGKGMWLVKCKISINSQTFSSKDQWGT